MIKYSLPIIVALTTAATAGEINSASFLYNSTPRETLEIDLKTTGECSFIPIKTEGKVLEARFPQCTLNQVYSIGKRGNLVENAVLFQKDSDTYLKVNLKERGKLKAKELASKIILQVSKQGNDSFSIKNYSTPEGEKVIISFPSYIEASYRKLGKSILIELKNFTIKNSRVNLHSYLIKGVQISKSERGSSLKLILSPQAGAVEVSSFPGRVELTIYKRKSQVNRKTKVALQFTNADIKDVVEAIAKAAKINVVFDPEVQGKVNANFKNPIDWKEALKAVLEPLGLTFIETPEYYRILPKYKLFMETANEPIKTYVITLNFVKAKDLAKVIEKMINGNREIKITKLEETAANKQNTNESQNQREKETTDKLAEELARKIAQQLSRNYTQSQEEKSHMSYGNSSSSGENNRGSSNKKSENNFGRSRKKLAESLKKEIAKVLKKIEDSYKNQLQNKAQTVITSLESVAYNDETNTLILRVTPTHYKEIRKLIKLVDKPLSQVLVKAKIVLISSKAEKEFGFSWFISGYNRLGDSSSSTYLASTYGFNSEGYSPIITPETYMQLSKMPVMDNTLALGILNKTQTMKVELALKAMELDGDAKLISSPKVLTLDNQEASIEQGVEIPYREATVAAGGATTYSINFKKASLILKVKPHVINNGKIVMDVEVRKDSPNYDYVSITGNNEPAINTRNVKSRVMISNGSTVVIGGIFEKEKRRNSTGVPVLSRIPLLGWLFKSEKTSINKTQLLIFITPTIVNSEGTEVGGVK
jgi:type IV pilus secretin PilQ/predicted competence protein